MTNEELKKIREDKGLKKGEFAKLLGVTPMIYGRYESGTLAIPDKVESAVGELNAKESDIAVEKADAAVVTEIEGEKTIRKAGRKTKEKVTEAVDTVADAAVTVSDKVAATEIEVKKKTRAAGRKAKEKVKDTVDAVSAIDKVAAAEIEAKKTVRKAGRKVKEKVHAVSASDKVVATEIETKKTVRKAARKTKAAVEDIAQAVKKNTAIMIQSQLGGMITPEEVLQRIPENCDAVYIKPEENKAYWVKGLESGCVNLW